MLLLVATLVFSSAVSAIESAIKSTFGKFDFSVVSTEFAVAGTVIAAVFVSAVAVVSAL